VQETLGVAVVVWMKKKELGVEFVEIKA